MGYLAVASMVTIIITITIIAPKTEKEWLA